MLLEQDVQNGQSRQSRGTEQTSGHGQLVGILRRKLVDVLKQVHQGILETTLQVLVAAHEFVENIDMLLDAGKIILSLEDAKGTSGGSILKESATGSWIGSAQKTTRG